MTEEKDDKQFEASAQKLRKAREDGDVPRSTEINVLAMYLGVWLMMISGAGVATERWLNMAARMLGAGGWQADANFALATSVGIYSGAVVFMLSLLPLAAIFIGLIAQNGLVFSAKKLAIDVKRLNPVKNAVQKFGKSGLITFLISSVKAALICTCGWFLFRHLLDRLASAALTHDTQWVSGLPYLLQQVLLLAIAISAAFAIVDFLWKRHEHLQKNRMTRKEAEDESKEAEGDPHLRAARRQRAIDIAMKQMLADVANADVVIVNPTHYAAALQWQRGSGRVPVCVAKGIDEVADRIRQKARENNVPIYSDPPCARAIHATVKIGEEIRREHFAAVAVAIRFAEQMRQKARKGW